MKTQSKVNIQNIKKRISLNPNLIKKIAALAAATGIAVTAYFYFTFNFGGVKIDPGKDGQVKAGIIAGNISNSTVTVGDTTSNAEDRGEKAFEQVKGEIEDNFLNLSNLIDAIEEQKPLPFWDIRRANETELAYQDRASAEFQKYQHNILASISKFPFTKVKYQVFERDLLAIDSKSLDDINKIYKYFDEVMFYVNRYNEDLSHVLSLHLKDVDRNKESTFYQKEELVDTKMSLLNAAAEYCCIVNEKSEVEGLSEDLKLVNIDLQLEPGLEGSKEALLAISKLADQEVALLAEKSAKNPITSPPPAATPPPVAAAGNNPNNAGEKGIKARVTDPYLLMLRKALGLGDTLTESEIFAMENNKIDMEETDPEKLFELAAYSYSESDGHAAVTYFERALKSDKLSPVMRKYAETSLHRLENPDVYQGSIGIIVLKTTPDGSFDKAGVKVGDVLVSLDGQVLNEPMEISSASGKSKNEPIMLGIIRNDEFTKAVIKSGEPAGAALSQLIMLNGLQL